MSSYQTITTTRQNHDSTIPTISKSSKPSNTPSTKKKPIEKERKANDLSSQPIVPLLPLPTPHVPIALTQPPQHRQHEADSEVRHVLSQHVRRVRDPNPLLLALVQVDLVHPDAEARDDLEPRQGVDELCIGAGGSVADDGTDGGGVVLDELGLLRDGPEPEEVEASLELLLEVGVHWAQHEYANGLHKG